MRQSRAKIISLLMAAAMSVSMLPTTAYAADAMTAGASKIAKEDYIYYGNYGNEDVKWKVLDRKTNTGGEGLFLMSEYVLDNGQVRFDSQRTPKSNEWAGSTAQGWCKEFAKNAFSAQELAAVHTTSKSTNESGNFWGQDFGTNQLNGDQVFFLSAKELQDYISTRDGEAFIARTSAGDAGEWWLRSSESGNYAGVVNDDGDVNFSIVNGFYGARPAFNLNLGKVLFASAAENGKTSNGTGPNALKEITGEAPNTWKLTVRDKAHEAFALTSVEWNGDTATIGYTNAKTNADGKKEYLSAVVMDGENPTHYGRILELKDGQEAGTGVTIKLPDGVTLDTDTKLYVFNEQCNGDKKTDYASGLKELSTNWSSENRLVSITQPGAIIGVANGTSKEDLGKMLPKTVKIETSSGSPAEATVTWDVDGCGYYPTSEQAQTFDVSGTVILPGGVTNPNNILLETSISVTVSKKPADNITGVSIKTGPNKTSYTEGETLDLTSLEIEILDANGIKEPIQFIASAATKGVSASPAHGTVLAAGTDKVTISAGTSSVNFAITVKEKSSGGGENPPGGGDRPSGGGGGSDDSHPDDDNYAFWEEVKRKVEKAEAGETVRVNARSYDKFPYDLMETLYDRGDVSLEIRWNGGETFTIPAGQALKPEKNRIFYRLEYLAQQYKDIQAAAPAPVQEEDPSKFNPDTGGGGFWDYLAFLFRSFFDAA